MTVLALLEEEIRKNGDKRTADEWASVAQDLFEEASARGLADFDRKMRAHGIPLAVRVQHYDEFSRWLAVQALASMASFTGRIRDDG